MKAKASIDTIIDVHSNRLRTLKQHIFKMSIKSKLTLKSTRHINAIKGDKQLIKLLESSFTKI